MYIKKIVKTKNSCRGGVVTNEDVTYYLLVVSGVNMSGVKTYASEFISLDIANSLLDCGIKMFSRDKNSSNTPKK